MSRPFKSGVSGPIQPLYDEIYKLSEGMFAELDRRGYLKKGLTTLTRDSRQKLLGIWNLSNRFGDALNYLYPLFSSRNPQRQTQIETLSSVGMNVDRITSLWIQSMVSYFLANVESIFRFTMVFFLNDQFFKDIGCLPKHMTVSRLLRELGDIYQPAEKFDEVFDMDIRNCLAHGSYWFENKEMHLASDPHLKNIRIMPLEDFMKAAMKTNVSAIAFVEALDSEMNKGTFRG